MRDLLRSIEMVEARISGPWVKRKAHPAMSAAAAKRKIEKVRKGIKELRDEAKANAELYRQIADDWYKEYEDADYELERHRQGHKTTDTYSYDKGSHKVRLASERELKRSLGQAMASESLRRAWREAHEDLDATLRSLDSDDLSIGEVARRLGRDPSEWGDYGADPLGSQSAQDQAMSTYRRSRKE